MTMDPNPILLAVQHARDAEHQRRQLERITADTTADTIAHHVATAGGDAQRLRGIPCMARGVGSTVPGTDPLRALLARQPQV